MENQQEVDEVQKRRLLQRIAFSLVILAGLVGSLAMFDPMHVSEPAVVPKVAATVAANVTILPPAEPPAAAPQSAPPEAKTEQVVPVHAAAADTPPLQAVADEKPPATVGPAMAGAGRERPAPTSGEALQRPFALQIGVFSKVANAEELLARLERSGIPASIEARVHVGPFATHAEADAARRKLKELGMTDSLLIIRKPRPPT